MGWFRRKEHDEEQLSAYLDGELDARQTRSVESHLSTCETCAALLEELRGTRSMLAALPTVAPRRSFVLGPEYATEPAAAAKGYTAPPSRRFSLVMAPAVAFSLFVALVAVDVTDFSGSSMDEGGSNEIALTSANSREAENLDGQAAGAAAVAPAMAPDSTGDDKGQAPDTASGSADAPQESAGTLMDAGNAESPPAGESAQATGAEAPSADAFAIEGSGEGGTDADRLASAESGGDGISTLRVLQVVAAVAFIASGFYVLVWPRLAREGSIH